MPHSDHRLAYSTLFALLKRSLHILTVCLFVLYRWESRSSVGVEAYTLSILFTFTCSFLYYVVSVWSRFNIIAYMHLRIKWSYKFRNEEMRGG